MKRVNRKSVLLIYLPTVFQNYSELVTPRKTSDFANKITSVSQILYFVFWLWPSRFIAFQNLDLSSFFRLQNMVCFPCMECHFASMSLDRSQDVSSRNCGAVVMDCFCGGRQRKRLVIQVRSKIVTYHDRRQEGMERALELYECGVRYTGCLFIQVVEQCVWNLQNWFGFVLQIGSNQ